MVQVHSIAAAMDVLLPEVVSYLTIFLSDANLFIFFLAGGWALLNKDVFRRLRLRTGRLQPVLSFLTVTY